MEPATQPKKVYLVQAEIHSLSTSSPVKVLIEQKVECETGKGAYDWLIDQARQEKGWISKAKIREVDTTTGAIIEYPSRTIDSQPAPPPPPKPCPLAGITIIEQGGTRPIALSANTCEEKGDDSTT